MNNVVRVTVQALAAVLGGTQSLHTNGYDEAIALPSAGAAALALRTQQILAAESGVTDWPDPLAGSFLVEHLTHQVEAEALARIERIEKTGGAAQAIEFMRDEIHREAYRFQMEVESGEQAVVGVNQYQAEEAEAVTEPPSGPDYRALEARQKTALAAFQVREGPAGRSETPRATAGSRRQATPTSFRS